MAKLNARQLAQVEAADKSQSGGFEAWPDGWYRATLDRVEERESQAGNMMWNLTFRDVTNEDGEKMRGSLWHRLMLPITKMPKDYMPKKFLDEGLTVKDLDEEQLEERQKSWDTYQNITAARIEEFFTAFGLTNDSDAEEAVDMECAVKVGHETANFGSRKGDVVNNVRQLKSLDELGWDESVPDGDGPGF